jgi:hypothetical protein
MIAALGRTMAATVALGLAAGAGAASAQTAPAEIVRTLTVWGLMGSWAVDCSRPVGQQWTRLRYAVTAEGRPVREVDYGDPKRNDRLDIVGATVGKHGTLDLVFYSPNGGQTRLLTLLKQPNKTIRAMSARVKDGEVTVVKGRFTATGNETPAQQKCD